MITEEMLCAAAARSCEIYVSYLDTSRGLRTGNGGEDVHHRRAGHRVRHAGGGGVWCGAVAAGNFCLIIRNSPAGYCSATAPV